MRLLNVFLAILYLSVLLSGDTRSASQAWVDNAEAKFSHSQSLISQQHAKIVDAETVKDPENKYPALLHSQSAATTIYPQAVLYRFDGPLPRQLSLLLGAPRAPPAIA